MKKWVTNIVEEHLYISVCIYEKVIVTIPVYMILETLACFMLLNDLRDDYKGNPALYSLKRIVVDIRA